MQRVLVQSDSIRSVGYDPQNSTLEVEFRERGTYRYYLVPRDVYDQLIKAPSAGRFVSERIVSGHFPFEEVT